MTGQDSTQDRDEQLRRDGVWRMLHTHLPDDGKWHNLVVRVRRDGDVVEMAGNWIDDRGEIMAGLANRAESA